MIVYNELGCLWKEIVIAYCKILFWNLPGESEGNYKRISG
jgi:hypothetical protein